MMNSREGQLRMIEKIKKEMKWFIECANIKNGKKKKKFEVFIFLND